jgi:threonine synthase
VSTADALAAAEEIARHEGIFSCPESATTVAGLKQAITNGSIGRNERIVILNTGSGLKSIPALPAAEIPVISSAAELTA